MEVELWPIVYQALSPPYSCGRRSTTARCGGCATPGTGRRPGSARSGFGVFLNPVAARLKGDGPPTGIRTLEGRALGGVQADD